MKKGAWLSLRVVGVKYKINNCYIFLKYVFVLFAAWVSSITMAVFLIFGPFMGAFVNRFGCRITITVGCLACATGLVLGSLAPNIVVLYLAFSVPFGIGMSSLYISSPVAMSQYFNKRRALALATATSGPGLGTMMFGPTLQALVDAFDWRNTMRMLAGLLAIASFTGCFLKSNSSLSSQRQDTNAKKFSLNFSACKNSRFLMLLAMAVVSNFGRIVPYVHLVSNNNNNNNNSILLTPCK